MPFEPLPRAVATGSAARDDADRVSPRRVGVAVGVLAALYLLLLYNVHRLPDAALRLVGGGTDAFARQGGLHMVWTPPPGYAVERLRSRPVGASMRLAIREQDAVVEIAHVAPEDVAAVAARLVTGPIEMHEVLETEEMKQLGRVVHLPMTEQWPVDLDVDHWREQESGLQHTDLHLTGERAAIVAKLAEAAAAGWKLPPRTHIAFEPVAPALRHDGRAAWRTFVLADEAEVDGDDVANAYGNYDASTSQPVVLIDFTDAGAERFSKMTARIVGHKLAVTFGTDVRSAPLIKQRITGGRASISMKEGDRAAQEHERDLLIATLRGSALPGGGRVVEATYVPPDNGTGLVWLARILVALAGGLVLGGAAGVVVHRTRPVRAARAPTAAGGVPWRRIAVTLLAPVVLVVLAKLPVLDLGGDLDFGMGGAGGGDDGGVLGMFDHQVSALKVGALGIAPIVAAYVLVELVALLVPGWRRRRHAGPVARQPIANAVIAVTVALVAIQAWLVTTSVESATEEPVSLARRLGIVGSLALGTLALAGVARLVRTRGLGNGYAALLAGGWLVDGVSHMAADASGGERMLAVAALGIIAVVVTTVLRWRVSAARAAGLRIPTTGLAALADAGGLVGVGLLVASVTRGSVSAVFNDATRWIDHGAVVVLMLVAVLAVVWSYVFARPAVLATVATRAGEGPPAREAWGRATVLSAGVLVGLALLVVAAPGARWIAEPATFAVVVAAVLDVVADARGRRGALVCVWSLQQPQHADTVARHLAAAEIPCHLSATGVRTLLAWFGPYVAIDVWVAPDKAAEAQAKLAALFA